MDLLLLNELFSGDWAREDQIHLICQVCHHQPPYIVGLHFTIKCDLRQNELVFGLSKTSLLP